MTDRRTADRTRSEYRVQLIANETTLDAELTDHSDDGARLRLETPVKIGTPVRLLVARDEFQGEVRYCIWEAERNRFAVGLRLGPQAVLAGPFRVRPSSGHTTD